MPDSEALTQLKRMTAWEKDPTLSSDELDALLEAFAKTDADGIAPGEEDWTPTYNLKAAAAEGWRWKAAKASELVSTDQDGDRQSTNQIFEHCQRMIGLYTRGGASVSTASAASE
jgi:hypothetical protein